jgi:cytosine/adenosine deaminase-related metal-dependent hydrolase
MEAVTASWVLPIAAPPIRNGWVAVHDGRVASVGAAADSGAPDDAVRDLGPGVLLPGLVNAHCHLELSHLAGRLPLGAGFVPWVESVVAARGCFSEGETRSAARSAIQFLEERGTAAVGDVSNTLDHLDLLTASGLSAVVFLELLSWDPEKAGSTMGWAEGCLAGAEPTLRPGLDVRLAAHAPHSCSPALLRKLVERAGPAAIHLAESVPEAAFLRDGSGGWRDFLNGRGLGHVDFSPPGTSPVRYADGLGVLHPRLVAAHAVQVDEGDRELLARRGVHVVLCPRSNRNLGVGIADLPRLLAAGVRLALGTDSLASVETLDVLEDAVLLHRSFPEVDPAAILRMATVGGAEALGFDDLGAIVPGRPAVLAFAPATSAPDDPCEFLLCGEARLRRVAVR